MHNLFFCLSLPPQEKQIKRSTRDAPSTRTTTDRPLLRTPCTTQTQRPPRGKSSALTPISTPSAPWFDVWVWGKEGKSRTHKGNFSWLLYSSTHRRFCMSPFLKTHNKDTVVQKHKAHFQQHFNGIRGRIPVITARWSSPMLLRFCEEKCSLHSVSVSLWIKEPRAYR